jgi:DNA-binding transcriptional ArsR family regulator
LKTEERPELQGKTLRLYLYLVKSGGGTSFGVRQVQRALGFKSPSIALYHLERLRDLGLVAKDATSGEYRLVKEVDVGVLKLYVKVSRFRLPRFLLYAVFTTSLMVSYLVLYPRTLSPHDLFALLVGSSATAILWYEVFRTLRDAPL